MFGYNLIFTAFPLCVNALTDSDIDLYDNKVTKKNLALLYKESRDTYRIFTFKNFFIIIFKGAIMSLLIFLASCVRQILTIKGFFENIWFLSLKSYMCVLFIVSANLLIMNNFIVIYLPLSILITTFLFFFIFLILNHFGILFEFNSKASIVSSLDSPILYLSIILTSGISIAIDYSFKIFTFFYNESLISKLNFRKFVKKREKRRLSSIEGNNISSKSYSNNNHSSSNINKRRSQDLTKMNKNVNPENTKNFLLQKSNNYILTKMKKLDIHQNDSKLNKYQNNVFTLKFRNINKVLNYKEDINKK